MKANSPKPLLCPRCSSDYLLSRPLAATDRLLHWLRLKCQQSKRFKCVGCFWEGLLCVK